VSLDDHGAPEDCFLSETDAALLADIVAHPYQLPTLTELEYTNETVAGGDIEPHIESLVRRDLIERVRFADGRLRPDAPDCFFGLTDFGQTVFFRRVPDWHERVLQEAYASVTKPPEIRKAERAPRPARTQ
jgi:hypothetical protein